MKLNKFYWGLALCATLSLASCSNDDAVAENNEVEISDGTPRYMMVTFQDVNNLGSSPYYAPTRANGYEASNPQTEYAIKKVRFYFFRNNGDAAKVKAGQSYYDVDVSTAGAQMDNIDQKYQAVLVISTKIGDMLPSKMIAVANFESLSPALPTEPSESALMEVVNNYAAANADVAGTGATLASDAKGLLMSSSVYVNSNKICAVSVSAKLKESQSAAEGDPVDIYLERVNAKVRVKVDAEKMTPITDFDDVYLPANGYTLTEVQQTALNANDENIYVKLPGWYITTETDKSYLIKNINKDWTEAQIFTDWNKAGLFRCFWAINPNDVSEVYHNYNYNYNTVSLKENNPINSSGNSLYTQENAADPSSENSAKEATPYTQVLVKGQLGIIDKTTKEFKSLTFSDWRTMKYLTKHDLLTNMLNGLANGIYIEDATATDADNHHVYDGVNDKHYRLLSEKDVDILNVSTKNSPYDKADANTLVSTGRYYSYLKLKEGVTDAKLFTKSGDVFTAVASGKVAELNETFAGEAERIQYWNEGRCYYYFDIRHLNNTSSGAGKYGVVRNHVYECKVQKLTGFGTPVNDPDEVIKPEPNETKDNYLAARINVLSWRVVSNNYDLGK